MVDSSFSKKNIHLSKQSVKKDKSKDKTLEELRKMASRKKIEGRSKMNKSELIRALKKKSTTKKTTKRKKMRGGIVLNGVNYSEDRFNFLFDLSRPSTNNTQRPRIYITPAVDISNISTYHELLEKPHFLITFIDDHIGASGHLVMSRALSNPPTLTRTGHIATIGEGVWVSENVYLIQDNEGNYRIYDTTICRINHYRYNPTGYQAKLDQLGLGPNNRLFPIIEPVAPAQE